MASGRRFYSVERRGHRDGYNMPDVDGLFLGDEEKERKGEKWEWQEMEEEILTDCDVDDLWRRWKEGCAVSNVLFYGAGLEKKLD
jgi:pyroglutamyl-peptidase